MYCVVVLHISYDDRLRSDRYEVTTQRHVGIAAQRWCEHRMESRRRRQAVSGTALVKDALRPAPKCTQRPTNMNETKFKNFYET